jgi:hypothetical protein
VSVAGPGHPGAQRRADGVQQLGAGCEAILAPLRKPTLDRVVDGRRKDGVEPAEAGWQLGQVRVGDRPLDVPRERLPTGKTLEQHAGQRVLVGATVDRVAIELLRRDVAERPGDREPFRVAEPVGTPRTATQPELAQERRRPLARLKLAATTDSHPRRGRPTPMSRRSGSVWGARQCAAVGPCTGALGGRCDVHRARRVRLRGQRGELAPRPGGRVNSPRWAFRWRV